MTPRVALIGRPNVGKSSLFNAMAERPRALVADQPGMTRDRRTAAVAFGDGRLELIDTGGWTPEGEGDGAVGELALGEAIRAQTARAVAEADAVVLVIDARVGATAAEWDLADMLRRQGKPVLVAANKAEGPYVDSGWAAAAELGLGTPVAVSASHAAGLFDLLSAVVEALDEAGGPALAPADKEAEPGPADREPGAGDPEPDAGEPVADMASSDASGDSAEDSADRPMALAILGRPNVGKSSLLNAFLGQDRVLTGAHPGITRDAIAVETGWGAHRIRFVDTAGLRRKSRIDDSLEKRAVGDSLNAIALAEVAVLVVDATVGLEKQDLTLAGHVVDEGRALVLALNKWDLVADRKAAYRSIHERLRMSFNQVRDLAVVPVSAQTGRGLDDLVAAAVQVRAIWNTRIATGPLNRWLEGALEDHPPPVVKGKRLKIRFATQVKARPPTFAFWVNRPEDLPIVYERYLMNGLREAFGLKGVPLRLTFRKPDNPYVS